MIGMQALSSVRRKQFRNSTRGFRSLSRLFLFVFFLNVALQHSEISRVVPRAVREMRRSTVPWRLMLARDLSKPVYGDISNKTFVYLISLDRTPDRRRPLTRQLDDLAIAYEVFNAVDGRKGFRVEDVVKYAGKRKQNRLGANFDIALRDDIISSTLPSALTLHERLRFGCYLSHVRIWEKLVRSQTGHMVILEDDVFIAANFDARLKLSLSRLPVTWDIFYLNSCFTKLGGVLRDGILQLKGALCTHGYAISQGGARKLLWETALRSEKPIDHMLDQALYSSLLSGFHADPPLIFPRDGASTLAYPDDGFLRNMTSYLRNLKHLSKPRLLTAE